MVRHYVDALGVPRVVGAEGLTATQAYPLGFAEAILSAWQRHQFEPMDWDNFDNLCPEHSPMNWEDAQLGGLEAFLRGM